MKKNESPRKKRRPVMTPDLREIAENALQRYADQEGCTLEETRESIREAILIGMSNEDPDVKRRWAEIPCEGEVPTPEEVLLYIAFEVHRSQ